MAHHCFPLWLKGKMIFLSDFLNYSSALTSEVAFSVVFVFLSCLFPFGILVTHCKLRQRWRRGTAGGVSAELGQIGVKNNNDFSFLVCLV